MEKEWGEGEQDVAPEVVEKEGVDEGDGVQENVAKRGVNTQFRPAK